MFVVDSRAHTVSNIVSYSVDKNFKHPYLSGNHEEISVCIEFQANFSHVQENAGDAR